MRKVTSVFKDCDIYKVLKYLTAGVPEKKYEKMVERYYSLYCFIMEQWVPNKNHEVVITDFKQTKIEDGEAVYKFFGVRDYCETDSMVENAIVWYRSLMGFDDVLIPECMLEDIDEDHIAAVILYEFEKEHPLDIPSVTNEALFKCLKLLKHNEKTSLSAIEKLLEKKISYELDKRLVINALFEHKESKGLVVKWKDVAGKGGFNIEGVALNSKERGYLEKRLVTGMLPPVYSWYYKLDKENKPDLYRCALRIEAVRDELDEVTLSDYENTVEEHLRIVVEENPACKALPIVFVRDKYGRRIEFETVDFSKLMCMDIFVTDKSMGNPSHVFAVLIFYMEYPLRAMRIIKKYMVQALLGMKFIYDELV